MNKKYTEEDEQTAIAMYVANGGNMSRTANELEIPRTSLQSIIDRHPIATTIVTIHKEKFIKTGWQLIFEALRELKKKTRIKDAATPELTRLVQIIFEKVSLAEGSPTGRTEHTKRSISVTVDGMMKDFRKNRASDSKRPAEPKTLTVTEEKTA